MLKVFCEANFNCQVFFLVNLFEWEIMNLPTKNKRMNICLFFVFITVSIMNKVNSLFLRLSFGLITTAIIHFTSAKQQPHWKNGKRSELRISQRRNSKRTSKKVQSIRTSKRLIKAIRTSKSELSQRRKANYHNLEKSWSLLRISQRRKERRKS
jgi:hypothetical protein